MSAMTQFKRKAITTEVTEEHRGISPELLGVPLCSLCPLWLKSLWKIAAATLREIFDESAYERFLARHKLVSSAASYTQFCRDREQTVVRRPRCC